MPAETHVTFEQHAEKLRRFLGPWGCQTALLDYEGLLDVSKRAFDVPGTNLVDVAVAVDRLSPVERRVRVRLAIRKHWPEPSRIWPAHANVRKALGREA